MAKEIVENYKGWKIKTFLAFSATKPGVTRELKTVEIEQIKKLIDKYPMGS